MSNNAVSEEKTRGFWRNVKHNLLGPEDVYIPSYMEEKSRNNQRKNNAAAPAVPAKSPALPARPQNEPRKPIPTSARQAENITALPAKQIPQIRRLPSDQPAIPTYPLPPNMRKIDYIDICREKLMVKDREIYELKRQVRDMQEEIIRFGNEVSELSADQEAQIARMQEAAFKSMSESRWTPMDDTTIGHELENLQVNISQLAKRHAVDAATKFSTMVSEDLREVALLLHEQGVARVKNETQLLEILDFRHGARICLTALLSAAVHGSVLSNPFFFLTDGYQDLFDEMPQEWEKAASRPDPADNFFHLYQLASSANLADANRWRSDTLRILSPEKDDPREAAVTLRGKVEDSLVDWAAGMAQTFMDNPVRILVQPMETPTIREGYRKALTALFEEAGRLAMRLWTQRMGVKYQFKPILLGEPFTADSKLMQPHGVHGDDSGSRELDGKRVVVVVHPAVLGTGTHDGEHYETSRVWTKAVVWLE